MPPTLPLLAVKRVTSKMSSYGAIGAEFDDTEPLFNEEARGVRIHRSASTSQVERGSYSHRRQPYLFTGGIGLSREGSTQSLHSDDDAHREHNMALRYRLYNRLDPGGLQLRMPDHVTQPELFSILPFDEMKDASGKQSSIVTIFSIWNTIMGTSLLAMPWALQQAGLVLGIVLFLTMCAICLYTAYLVVESPKNIPDLSVDPMLAEFSDICKHFYGRTGQTISVLFSVIVFMGGIIVYWVLMSNFMFYTGNVVYDALQPNSSTIPIMENKTFTCDVYCPAEYHEQFLWDEAPEQLATDWWNFDHLWQLQGTVPFYLALLTFPLFNFKSPTFFTKFNVLGTISVVYLLVFTGSKFLECGINVNFTDPLNINYVKLANWKFPALTGTLTLSYFIHNAIRTILRNQKKPENNVRDLTIAYFLCAFCYIYIALTFFLGFPVQRSCISDNFLNNFGTGDILSSTARLFLLFQMITVLPLLMYLIRNQLCYTVCGDPYPGVGYVVMLNLGVMSIAILFAVFYPKVGSILRYVGALCGLVYVFTLPNLVHMRKLHLSGQLTSGRRFFHTFIIAIGVLNLIAQFCI